MVKLQTFRLYQNSSGFCSTVWRFTDTQSFEFTFISSVNLFLLQRPVHHKVTNFLKTLLSTRFQCPCLFDNCLSLAIYVPHMLGKGLPLLTPIWHFTILLSFPNIIYIFIVWALIALHCSTSTTILFL